MQANLCVHPSTLIRIGRIMNAVRRLVRQNDGAIIESDILETYYNVQMKMQRNALHIRMAIACHEDDMCAIAQDMRLVIGKLAEIEDEPDRTSLQILCFRIIL